VSRRAKIISAILVVAVIAGLVVFFVVRSRGAGPLVSTATVEQRELSVVVQASGTVETGIKSNLFPPTAGTLAEVAVQDGQKVEAGQEIASMDTAPLELTVSQAKTGLAQAQAQLDSVDQQAPSSADLAAARANVSAAEKAYTAAKAALADVGKQAPSKAQLDAAHAATIAAKQAYDTANAAYLSLKASIEASPIPTPDNLLKLSQLETTKDQAYAAYLSAKATEESLKATSLATAKKQAQAAVDQALAALRGAQAQLAKLESSSTSAAREAAQQAIDQAEEAVKLATDNLDKATFVAPFAGVVLFNPLGTPGADGEIPKASTGAAVTPGAAPFTVVDLSGVRFSADVDEADVSGIKPDTTAEIALDAFPGETFKSTVIEVRSAAQQTATGGTVFPVDLTLDESGKQVLIGMQGDASISVSSIPNAVVIPIEALFDQNGRSYVYVVSGGHLKKTTITTGAMTQTSVQVLSGVEPGQVVALSGSVEFSDGMAVRTQ
jgi:HlyD family secretion protein